MVAPQETDRWLDAKHRAGAQGADRSPPAPAASHHSPVRLFCDPMDCSPPGSSVHRIFPGQECWSGFPCPPPGDLPNLRDQTPVSCIGRWVLYLAEPQGQEILGPKAWRLASQSWNLQPQLKSCSSSSQFVSCFPGNRQTTNGLQVSPFLQTSNSVLTCLKII